MKKTIVLDLEAIHLKLLSEHSTCDIKNQIIAAIQNSINSAVGVKALLKVATVTTIDGSVLFKSDIYPGRIVRTIHNEIGIISNYRPQRKNGSIRTDQKAVAVILPGHRIWYYEADELFKTDATFEEVRCIRLAFSRKENLWHEGDSGYIFHNNKRVPIIIGQSHKGMVLIHEVSNNAKRTDTKAEIITYFSAKQYMLQPSLYECANEDFNRTINQCIQLYAELKNRIESIETSIHGYDENLQLVN